MADFIPKSECGREFQACWTLAASYIQRLGYGELEWFKGNLYSPIYEHFSFRLRNQLFFVRLEDAEGRLRMPGTLGGLLEISRRCHGHPLIMPMKNIGGIWLPIVPGWGLLDAFSKVSVSPESFPPGESIPLSQWELQDRAVASILSGLDPASIVSFTNHPYLSPSIWYEGESGLEWVIVRRARTMGDPVSLPSNFSEILTLAELRGAGNGYLASVYIGARERAAGITRDNGSLYRGDILDIKILKMSPIVERRSSTLQALES
ncbi:MAG: hypothetical protein LBE27_08495 [Deltaproteobacteria bacterium]|jgi:hypothetical protein|nr:hypothetical protein [Deltaproteobacteria bacterium]